MGAERLGPDELSLLIDAMQEEQAAVTEGEAVDVRIAAARERIRSILESNQRLKDIGIDAEQMLVQAALDGQLVVRGLATPNKTEEGDDGR